MVGDRRLETLVGAMEGWLTVTGGGGKVDKVVKHFGKFDLFFLVYKRVTLVLLLLFTG